MVFFDNLDRSQLVSFIFFLLVIFLIPLSILDFRLHDVLLRISAAQESPDNRIVVIDVDEGSIKAMENAVGQWPWPRAVHAEIIEYLQRQQASAVIFDILFSERDIYRPDSDQYFIDVVQASNNVFLPILDMGEQSFPASQLLSAFPPQLGLEAVASAKENARRSLLLPIVDMPVSGLMGTINFQPDSDGVGRHYRNYTDIEGWKLYAMPYLVVKLLGGDLPKTEQFMVNWRSLARKPYATYSFAEVYHSIVTAKAFGSGEVFKDKIVVIGSSASGLHDIRQTPIDNLYPAVYILTTAIDNLLNQQQLTPLNPIYEKLLGGVILFILYLSFVFAWTWLTRLAIFIAATVFLLMASFLFLRTYTVFYVSSVILCLWGFYLFSTSVGYLKRRRELRETIDLFGRFLHPDVVKQVISKGFNQDMVNGETRNITILFSDIRNFTGMSEHRSAPEVLRLINGYFEKQVDVIFEHGGTLDKFIGDAIMAFWGAPIDTDNHAVAAVMAAKKMADNLEAFRCEYDLSEFDIGIGIHTGTAVVGLVGSQRRYDYTAIGDSVNLASRIEGLTKEHSRILVSEATKAACAGHFDFVSVGSYKVKGREEAVSLYSLCTDQMDSQ